MQVRMGMMFVERYPKLTEGEVPPGRYQTAMMCADHLQVAALLPKVFLQP
jgi:hypothetical protein